MAATLQLDRSVLRTLVEHEAKLQATGGRELRDLGDAIILLDPKDPEPYWNRLIAPEWPAERRDFDERVDAAITLFATLGRIPHIWPYPSANQPTDIVQRLQRAGFEVMGSDRLMVLVDERQVTDLAAMPLPAGVTIERLHGLASSTVRAVPDIADVLADAFGVDDERRLSIEVETLTAFEGSALHVILLRVDGRPAAVAKRSTLAEGSYLSSIGTRRGFRRHGLGALVTAIATADALAAGSRWTYLKVDTENWAARRLYGGLGYVAVPGQVDDLLLRR